jgi:hypothetical protein
VRDDLVRRYNFDTAWGGRVDAFTKVSDHVATLIGARRCRGDPAAGLSAVTALISSPRF